MKIEHVAAMAPVTRSPDPAFQILHPSFAKFRLASGTIERIASGCRWAEGPVWFGDARCLLWSDIPNNRIMRWDEETGAVSVFRKPSGHANGATRDRQGRLIACEHSGRQVTRTKYDGEVAVLLDQFEGKPLNSPNDVVVKSDGSIWFTDPTFGIVGYYQGEKAEQELPERVLSHRSAFRRSDDRGGGNRGTEWAGFFAGRNSPLHRPVTGAAENPIL